MENINFSLIEKSNNVCVDNVYVDNVCVDNINIDNINIGTFLYTTHDIEELKRYYTSYTIKSLLQILNYYGLTKNKMVKDEIIQMILFFETDRTNKPIVERRIRLWSYIQELKADSYFSKYILF